jgi:ABC-type polysaccharide/polyol phosphate transport system ATPase subunit
VAVDDTNRTSRSLTTQQQAASLQVATPHRRTIRVVSGELTVIADGLSKQYPGKPGKLFPPVVSIFHRKYFTRSSREEERKDAPPILMGMAEDPDDLDDLDDDDEAGEDDDEAQEEPQLELDPEAGEWVWALRDISFELRAGQGLGLLGGPRAGKSTLLRIIGGRSFPTEGRVLVRDPVSPPPPAYATSIGLSGRGTFTPSVLLGSALAGYPTRVVRRHRDEIEELGRLGLSEEDLEKQGLVLQRLALAGNVILPSKVILLERLPEPDDPFTRAIVGRVRQRLREGASLVLAARTPELLRELCDEVIVLDRGRVVEQGSAQGATAVSTRGNGREPLPGPPPIQEAGESHPLAALISAEVLNESAQRPSKRRVRTEHELLIELRLQTNVQSLEVRCGMDFTAHNADVPVRLELPEPVSFQRPGTYVLSARADPGTLEPGRVYRLRADAVISHPDEPTPVVLTRELGRLSAVGDAVPGAADQDPTAVSHWSGGTAMRAASEWSIG